MNAKDAEDTKEQLELSENALDSRGEHDSEPTSCSACGHTEPTTGNPRRGVSEGRAGGGAPAPVEKCPGAGARCHLGVERSSAGARADSPGAADDSLVAGRRAGCGRKGG